MQSRPHPLIRVMLLLLGCALLAATQASRLPVGSAASAPEPVISLTAQERAYLDALGPLTVAPDPDWIPYEHVDAAGRFTGIAADMLELIGRRLALNLQYVPVKDWTESVALSKAGRVLILPFLNQTPARDEWLIFTEPLLVEPSVFITREEHPFIYDATQLTEEAIVFPKGTSLEERVRRDFPNLRVFNVASENEVFQALSNRQADMTLRPLTVAAYTIRKEGLFNLKIAGQAPESYVNRLRIGVLKSEPMLRDILNKGIASLTPAEREAIVNAHVNITVVEPIDRGLMLQVAGVLSLLIGLSFFWNYRLKKINTALQESERSKAVLLSNLPGMAYRCRMDRQWTMEFVSEGCLELTGHSSEDLLHNRVVSYNDLIAPEERERVWALWQAGRKTGKPVEVEYPITTADQTRKWVYERGVVIETPGQSEAEAEGLIIDISDRKRAEEALYQASIQDHLTGLYNQRYASEQLATLWAQYQRERRDFSVVILDLDCFKRVNDDFGHQAGDFVLRSFARLLSCNSRPYDLVGRYGGEAFVIICVNVDLRETELMLLRLLELVRQHVFDYSGNAVSLTCSAGVSNTAELEPSESVDKLIRIADERLYQAKARGRDQVVCR